MTKIKAFKAITYNQEKIGDYNKVICPPYDVISPKQQDKLAERSEFNLVHVLLAKESPDGDKYLRAGNIFHNWLREKILVQDGQPAIYFYSQQYNLRGEKKARFGFISLLKLGDEKKYPVYGHENTHVEAKEDRLRLIKEVNANLSPIFVIFGDKKRIIQRVFQEHIRNQRPLIEVADDEKTVHKLWPVTGLKLISEIESSMENELVFIADGHHRYEVSCVYRDFMRSRTGRVSGEEDFDYMLSYFTNTGSRGLSVLPIHRLLILKQPFESEEFRLKIKENFDLIEIKDKARFFFLMQKAGATEHLIGLYKEKKFWLLRLKNVKILDKLILDKTKEYRTLDVSILNYLIFKRVFGLDPDDLKNVIYSPDPDWLIEEAGCDNQRIVFFLNPVKTQQIIAVALSGSKMPPKSTYFYPKVLSGLVINKFCED